MNAFTDEGRTPDQQQVFRYVRELLQLRLQHESLRIGKLWHLQADDSSYVFLRETETEKLVVAFNNSTGEKSMRILLRGTPAENSGGISTLSGGASGQIAGRDLRLTLPPESLSILQLQ